MARRLTSSAFLYTSSIPSALTYMPVTMAVWGSPGNVTSNMNALRLGLSSSDYTNNFYILYAGGDAGDYGKVVSADSGLAVGSTSASFSANVWSSLVGIVKTSGGKICYLDGAGGSENTTTKTPTGINKIFIGTANANGGNLFTGDLCEVAAWSVDLKADEITSLAKGFPPRRIRPQSLLFYAPFLRNIMDWRSGLSFTESGTTSVAAHARRYGK